MENSKITKGKTILKAGIGYTVGDIIIKLFSFLTIPLFTRLMAPDQFGLYTTFFTYESLLMILLGMSLAQSIKSANLEFSGKINNYVSNLILLLIPGTVLLLAVAFIFGSPLEKLMGYPSYMLAVMVIISFSNTVVSIFNERVSIEYQYKKYLLVSGVTAVGSAVFAILLILFVTKTETYIGRTLGLALIFLVCAIAIILNFFKKAKPKFDKTYSSFALKYSVPLIPQAFFQIVFAQYGKIAVNNLVGETEAGIYGFAFSLIQILQVIIVAMSSVYGPWFFENYKEGKIEAIRSRSVQYVILFGFITVGFMALCPEVITIMADKEYHDCIKIMVPAAIGIFFYFMYQIPLQAAFCKKQTVIVSVITIFAGVLNVVLCNVFVGKFGYEFAAYITSASYLLCFVLYSVLSKILLKKLPYNLLKVALITLVVIGCGVLISLNKENFLIRIGIIILSLPVLIACDPDIIKEARTILKGRKNDE